MADSELTIEGETEPVVTEVPAAPRKRMTAAEQYVRNENVVAARIQRRQWADIAQEYGLSTRRCKQIYAEWQSANPTMRHNDPVEIVDELLTGYDRILSELAAVVKKTENDNARVGALNSMRATYREMAELLQAINVLPQNLGDLTIHLDANVMAERVMAVIERYEVPEDMWADLASTFGARAPLDVEPLELPQG